MEEIRVLKITMFETLMLAVLAIYFGDFLRKKIPVLVKYCLPASVVGGTVFALISLGLYEANIVQLEFDYKSVNQLFYCIFFAANITTNFPPFFKSTILAAAPLAAKNIQ